jgi:hypothetical protein
MKKLFAFIAFTYHLCAYQRPLKLMHKLAEDSERNIHENGSMEDFEAIGRRFLKQAEIVMYHQAKCDEYKAIINA